MKIVVKIPDNKNGNAVSISWSMKSRVECSIHGDQVTILGNNEGLFSLATALLSLAQKNVPDSSHHHIDTALPGFSSKVNLVFEKKSKWD